MNRPRCDIIIPVKNAVWWVDICLAELFARTDDSLIGEVIIINDRSTPAEAEQLQNIARRYPRSRVYDSTERPGFGGSCNYAVTLSRADYFLLLNSDCFLTEHALEKLLCAFDADPQIGLVCPLSNNSPELDLPIASGYSYFEMNRRLNVAMGIAQKQCIYDACLVTGNCLLISRKCWDQTGGFNECWGTGYGEESDFHMRALELGFRGVVRNDCYVYHYGSGTFRDVKGIEEQRQRNFNLFMQKWREPYQKYRKFCDRRSAVQDAKKRLEATDNLDRELDVMLFLPGLSQEVGGMHVIINLANELLRRGLRVAVAIYGNCNLSTITYREPLYFSVLHIACEKELFARKERVKCICAPMPHMLPTLSAFAVLKKAQLTYFVQGYEFFFLNGSTFNEAELSFAYETNILTTSRWLKQKISFLTKDRPLTSLPLPVNQDMYYPRERTASEGTAKIRLMVVIRSAPDKGQPVLLDVLMRLREFQDSFSLTILKASSFPLPQWVNDYADATVISFPLTRAQIAQEMQRCDVLLDASLHEGYGLFVLEGICCGLAIITSDSGGIREFVEDGKNGVIVKSSYDTEAYLEALRELSNRETLARFAAHSRVVAARYTSDLCWDRYAEYFRDQAKQDLSPQFVRGSVENLLQFRQEDTQRSIILLYAAHLHACLQNGLRCCPADSADTAYLHELCRTMAKVPNFSLSAIATDSPTVYSQILTGLTGTGLYVLTLSLTLAEPTHIQLIALPSGHLRTEGKYEAQEKPHLLFCPFFVEQGQETFTITLAAGVIAPVINNPILYKLR